MSPVELSIPFGLGVVSSLHCSQMCGPIVLAYSLPLASAGRRAASAHLTYNAGRLLTYSLLGAIAGALGGGIASVGRLAGIEKTGSILAGAFMILTALALSGWMARPATVQIGASPSIVSRLAGRLLRAGSASNKLLLGLVMGLLPCGMVYAALLKAVEAGTPLDGALSMLAFGAGTSGALLAIGFFSSAITARLGRYATALACASMLLLGGFLLYRGFRASSPAAPHCPYHANPS